MPREPDACSDAPRPISPAGLIRAARADDGALRSPPPQWWSQDLPGLLRDWRAHGAYLGHKVIDGDETGRLSLVVQTLWKHTPGRAAGASRIPKQLRWRDGRYAYVLDTDVVECTACMERQRGPVYGPGDVARVGGSGSTIGAAVNHARHGRCLMTVGHLFSSSPPPGTRVQVDSRGGSVATQVVGYAEKGSIDYAILRPLMAAPVDNLVQDTVRIGPVYTPTFRDVGTPLRVVRQDGQFWPTRCEGVQQHFVDQGVFYANMILTTGVTRPGDSGGALVDEAERVWGFLIGERSGIYAAFVPAHLILHAAGVSLS